MCIFNFITELLLFKMCQMQQDIQSLTKVIGELRIQLTNSSGGDIQPIELAPISTADEVESVGAKIRNDKSFKKRLVSYVA